MTSPTSADPIVPADRAAKDRSVADQSGLTPRNGWWRLLALIGPVVALFVATFGTAGLSWLLLGAAEDSVPAGVVTVVVLGQSAAVSAISIGLAALLSRLHGLRLRDIGLRWTPGSAARLLLGAGLGVGVVLLVGLPLTWLGLLRVEETIDLPWWALIVAGLAQALLLQGFPEELLFRGYQMSALRWRPVPALLMSAGVFASIHLVSNGGQQNAGERILYLTMPFGFAFAGGALMILTDSLWAAVGVHAGLHVGFLAGQFVGLGTGPWLWTACGALWTVIGVLLLLAARRRSQLDTVWSGPTR